MELWVDFETHLLSFIEKKLEEVLRQERASEVIKEIIGPQKFERMVYKYAEGGASNGQFMREVVIGRMQGG